MKDLENFSWIDMFSKYFRRTKLQFRLQNLFDPIVDSPFPPLAMHFPHLERKTLIYHVSQTKWFHQCTKWVEIFSEGAFL